MRFKFKQRMCSQTCVKSLPGDKSPPPLAQASAFSFSQHEIPGEIPVVGPVVSVVLGNKGKGTRVFWKYLHSCQDVTGGKLCPVCPERLLWDKDCD